MNKEEFFRRTNEVLTPEEFTFVQKVFEVSNYSVEEFCNAWRSMIGRTSLMAKMNELAEARLAEAEEAEAKLAEFKQKGDERFIGLATLLIEKGEEHNDETLNNAAAKLVGVVEVIKIKLSTGHPLTESERDLIISKLR